MDTYLKENLKIDGVQIGDVLILPVKKVKELIKKSEKIGREKEKEAQQKVKEIFDKKYFLTSAEACNQLGLKSFRTIANRIRAGKLGGQLIGGNWMTTQFDIDEYKKVQGDRSFIKKTTTK